MNTQISLNVGGTRFETTRLTLFSRPESMLAKLVSYEGDKNTAEVSYREPINIDRDAEYFYPILEFLRSGELVLKHGSDLDLMKREADFYGLPELVKLCDAEIGDFNAFWVKVVRRKIDNPASSIKEWLFAGFLNVSALDLSEFDLSCVDFSNSIFTKCNLAKTNFSSSILNWNDMQNSNLSGAIFSNASLVNADLRQANLTNVDLNGGNLQSVNLEGVTLDGANCEGANMQDANLKNSTFSNSNCKKTDLQNANLCGAVIRDVVCTNANFCGTNFQNTRLQSINFEGALMKKSNLQGAHLIRCTMFANLKDADMTGATLDGTDFTGALLDGVKWQGVKVVDQRHNQKHKYTKIPAKYKEIVEKHISGYANFV